jgi:hypothetical protein
MFFTNLDISLRITDLDPGGQLITIHRIWNTYSSKLFREFLFYFSTGSARVKRWIPEQIAGLMAIVLVFLHLI